MFKPKKNLIFVFYACLLLLFCFLTPLLKTPIINIIKAPMRAAGFLRQELGALIFYHRNFTQNTRLTNENNLLRNRLNNCREAVLENARLKQLLSFKQNSKLKFITARVIGRSPDNWSSSIIIDKGRRSGIKRGKAVFTYLGLIGRVVETEGEVSKVMLLNDPGIAISALVQRSRQEGLVSGTLGVNLIMRYLPEAADITKGDVIIASGLNENYPKAAILGTVAAVGRDFSGLSLYALVRPAVNLSGIEEVLVGAE